MFIDGDILGTAPRQGCNVLLPDLANSFRRATEAGGDACASRVFLAGIILFWNNCTDAGETIDGNDLNPSSPSTTDTDISAIDDHRCSDATGEFTPFGFSAIREGNHLGPANDDPKCNRPRA